MTHYVLVAALPIVITSELSGSDLDAGLAMTYFQIGTIICRLFAGRLIDGFNKRIVLLISTALFFIIMGLFNLTTSLDAIFVLRGLHGVVFALGTTVMSALAVLVLPPSRKGEVINMFAIFSNVAMVLGPAIGLYALSSYGSIALYIFLTAMTGLAMLLSNVIPLSKFIIYPGLGLFILGLFGLGLATTPMAIILTAPLLGLGYGAAQPAFQALAIQSAPIERAGVSTATYFLALDISVGAGSIILALLANALGYQYLYIIAALVMVIALSLYHVWIKKYTPLEI